MDAIFNEDWTADVVARMHKFRITNEQLAEEYGCTPGNLSVILNGRKKTKPETRDRVLDALKRIEDRVSVNEGGENVGEN